MHFAFTEEQTMIADMAKGFFAENATSERTRAAMADNGVDAALWQGFAQELGFGGVIVPETDCGTGLGMVELAILAEAAGAHVAALPMLGSIAMTARAIVAGGSDTQKADWLPKLVSGEAIGACAGSLELHADGDLLSGKVDFVPHGGAASVFVLGSGAETWLVRVDAPGLTVETLTTMDQTRPFARLVLKEVAGEPLADGEAAMIAARHAGWVCVAAEALGGAQACLDRTIGYSLERVQFGRQIGSFQAYKHRLADMMIEIEQARSAVYWAACAVDEASPDAPIALHAAKSLAADAYAMCAGNMIQLHGGIGFTWEHDAHLYFKRARAIQSMLGNGNWHREQVARLMGLGEAA
jgi:alkylation response protein AidB-like acyl-CoA dehydrogenase